MPRGCPALGTDPARERQMESEQECVPHPGLAGQGCVSDLFIGWLGRTGVSGTQKLIPEGSKLGRGHPGPCVKPSALGRAPVVPVDPRLGFPPHTAAGVEANLSPPDQTPFRVGSEICPGHLSVAQS